MKVPLSLFFAGLAGAASAGEGTISGRFTCDVVKSRFVAAAPEYRDRVPTAGRGFPAGMPLTLDYVLDGAGGLSVSLGEAGGGEVFIDEPFPAATFAGVSGITNTAEFRAPYSEVSFGRFGLNYKGSDQVFLKTACGKGGWRGHYVQTHVSGYFTQVVTLECRPFVDAADAVLARLAVPVD
jgi:hypothetical protein